MVRASSLDQASCTDWLCPALPVTDTSVCSSWYNSIHRYMYRGLYLCVTPHWSEYSVITVLLLGELTWTRVLLLSEYLESSSSTYPVISMTSGKWSTYKHSINGGCIIYNHQTIIPKGQKPQLLIHLNYVWPWCKRPRLYMVSDTILLFLTIGLDSKIIGAHSFVLCFKIIYQ